MNTLRKKSEKNAFWRSRTRKRQQGSKRDLSNGKATVKGVSGHVLNPVLINGLLRARQEKELRNLQEGVRVDFQNSSVSKYMTVSQGKYCRPSLIRYKFSRPFVLQ
jgi:hypothetical protein